MPRQLFPLPAGPGYATAARVRLNSGRVASDLFSPSRQLGDGAGAETEKSSWHQVEEVWLNIENSQLVWIDPAFKEHFRFILLKSCSRKNLNLLMIDKQSTGIKTPEMQTSRMYKIWNAGNWHPNHHHHFYDAVMVGGLLGAQARMNCVGSVNTASLPS